MLITEKKKKIPFAFSNSSTQLNIIYTNERALFSLCPVQYYKIDYMDLREAYKLQHQTNGKMHKYHKKGFASDVDQRGFVIVVT